MYAKIYENLKHSMYKNLKDYTRFLKVNVNTVKSKILSFQIGLKLIYKDKLPILTPKSLVVQVLKPKKDILASPKIIGGTGIKT